MSSDESDSDEEDAMESIREEYLMDLFTNCQTCLDPISGEKLLVADLSYTIRLLSVEERYNLRSENELASEVEDNLIFERRSATTLAERGSQTLVGTSEDNSLFARENDDASKGNGRKDGILPNPSWQPDSADHRWVDDLADGAGALR
jgi:hypothetical protein